MYNMYELTQQLSNIYISLKLTEFEYVTFEFELHMI